MCVCVPGAGLTRTLALSFRVLPGGKNAVELPVTSKLSHSSAWVVQSIQPTFTRPSCREHAHKHTHTQRIEILSSCACEA